MIQRLAMLPTIGFCNAAYGEKLRLLGLLPLNRSHGGLIVVYIILNGNLCLEIVSSILVYEAGVVIRGERFYIREWILVKQ